MMLTKVEYAIDMLELLQDQLEVMSIDEIYTVLEEIINILLILEGDT